MRRLPLFCLLSLTLVGQESSELVQFKFISSANRGDLPALKQLLEQGAQINQEGAGRTALEAAAARGHLEIVKYLIENGASVERGGKRTPFLSAIRGGHGPVVEWLVTSGHARCAALEGEAESPLSEAIKANQMDIVHLLLSLGADPNVPEKGGQSCLFKAVASGNLEVSEILLREGKADPNLGGQSVLNAFAGRSPSHRETASSELLNLLIRYGAEVNPKQAHETPLMAAVRAADLPLCKLLLDAGAWVDHPSSEGLTPLHVAVEKDREDLARFLLGAKADPLKADGKGVTPLVLSIRMGNIPIFTLLRAAAPKAPIELAELVQAAANGQLNMVRHLIQLGGDPKAAHDPSGNTLLLEAVQKNDFDFVRFLITEAKVDPNAVNAQGQTALMKACAHGHLDMAQLLVVHGAIVDIADVSGFNALHSAVTASSPETLAWLLRQYPWLVNRCDRTGESPAHLAVKNANAMRFLPLLARAGANLELVDSDGRSVLHEAAAYSKWVSPEDSVVRYLIEEHHVSPRVADHGGRTPLLDAAGSGSEGCTRYLMGFGGLDAVDKGGNGLLHEAARSGILSVLKILVAQKGLEVDRPNKEGWTPLLWGARYPAIFDLLLQQGANPSVKSKDGETPLLRAAAFACSGSLERLLAVREIREQVNQRNPKGETPLLRLLDKRWTKSENPKRSLEFLLKAGADPRMRNAEGKDVAMLAQDFGDPALVALLR